jgi:putative hemolysin
MPFPAGSLAGSALGSTVDSLLSGRVPSFLDSTLRRALRLDRLVNLYDELAAGPGDRPLAARLLDKLEITCRISDADLRRIPREGPAIVVANHPFGLLDAAILAARLGEVRTDVRFLGNYILGSMPELRNNLILVDPFAKSGTSPLNIAALREALQTLNRGGMVAMFPAGEVAHARALQAEVQDRQWSPSAGWLCRKAGVDVLPIFIQGANGPLFQLAGLLHPLLRTAMLPRELLNKRGREVRVRIGQPVPASKLNQIASDQERADYLRARTQLLAHSSEFRTRTRQPARSLGAKARRLTAISPAVAPHLLQRDVAALPAERCLASLSKLQCWLATADEVPNVLQEIGRLREVSFRAAGEGTGHATDLDEFDDRYRHLFVWNAETHEVVGAYRFAQTDSCGRKGLYTAALFDYSDSLLERMGPALELGRSFVRPEYQTAFAPLLLLWKAIGRYVADNPRYKVLFGPVSISNSYPAVCRQLMVSFFTKRLFRADWAKLVRARNPFRADENVPAGIDLDDLCSIVGDIEPAQPGVPVLLRHYLGLGGRLLGFNVDKSFGDALDGLIVVDLTQTEPKLLARYLGKSEAARFLAFHEKA